MGGAAMLNQYMDAKADIEQAKALRHEAPAKKEMIASAGLMAFVGVAGYMVYHVAKNKKL